MVFLTPVTSLATRQEIEPRPSPGRVTDVGSVTEEQSRAVPYLWGRPLARRCRGCSKAWTGGRVRRDGRVL